MDSRKTHRNMGLVALVCAVTALPFSVQASGARQGVKTQPGEIALLRDVSTRPAYRPAPPGMALIVNPTPLRELGNALGLGMDELSDDDYAQMGSSLADTQPHGQTTVERVTGSALTGALGRATGDGGPLSGGQLSQAIGGPMGAVSGATRGIGDQVRGALAQFPLAPTGGK